MPIADVLLISAYPLRLDPGALESAPPLSKAMEVAPGIQLAGVREPIASAVLAASRFREHPRDSAVIYGLVRYDPPGRRWDEDNAMAKVLYLSHFVRAHDGGFEFTARLTTDDSGTLVSLTPADVAPPFARAYCAPGLHRRWLTQAEGVTLRDLVESYDRVLKSLADTRVGLAISMFGESPFVAHGRPRGLLLTTTLEGLVSTRPERALKQFTTRVPPLAAEVGLPHLDSPWAERVYRLRSKLAHGGSVLGSRDKGAEQTRRDEFNQALADLDELLRRLLRTALLDPAFMDRLENIDRYWPVPGKGCPRCRTEDAALLDVECPHCHAVWQ